MDFNDINKKSKDTKTEKTSRLLMDNLANLVLVAISFVWLFYGYFKPVFSDVPIWIRLLSSSISIVVSVLIASTLGMQAIVNGEATPNIQALKKKHHDIIEEANTYAEYSDKWSDEENANALKKARTHKLSTVGLKYSEYFDEGGGYTNKEIQEPNDKSDTTKKFHKERLNGLTQAITMNLTPISFASISSDSKINYDINAMEDSPTEFHRKSTAKKFLSKLATVAVLGNISWQVVIGQNWKEGLFNGAFQLVVFLLFGSIEYMKNYNYVTNNYKQTLEKKISAAKRLIAYGKRQRGEVNNV